MKDIEVKIDCKSKSYKVNFSEDIYIDLKNKIDNKKIFIITDENVFKLYGKELIASLKQHNLNISKYILKPGENSKNITNLTKIFDKLIDNNFNRDDNLVSLGGGVVGDISGLAASTYKRGMNLIQIPTTLLSQVDSSVGGKTAINFNNVKNIIGTFYNPQLVLINSSYLDTLSKREFLNGFAEVIKTAILSDEQLFNLVANNNYKNLINDKNSLEKIIRDCIIFKRDIIQDDLYDQKKRRILNLGHTLGHVLETHKKLNYKHGEAVALGMKYAALFSVYKNLLNRKEYDKIIDVIKKYELPTKLDLQLNYSDLINNLKKDKKITNNKIKIVLLNNLFNPVIKTVSESEIKEVWEWFCEESSCN